MRATNRRRTANLVIVIGFLTAGGCAAPSIDFSRIQRPPRSSELDAYELFVGSWDWEATLSNAEAPDDEWTGTAQWEWILDRRCLRGTMTSKSQRASFAASGVWSRDPRSGKYIWWMFNDWGYPQYGSASYDEAHRRWVMKYRSVGLDGTTSYGEYRITVVDNDTLEWQADEWADVFHLFKKMEMRGTYRRRK